MQCNKEIARIQIIILFSFSMAIPEHNKCIPNSIRSCSIKNKWDISHNLCGLWYYDKYTNNCSNKTIIVYVRYHIYFFHITQSKPNPSGIKTNLISIKVITPWLLYLLPLIWFVLCTLRCDTNGSTTSIKCGESILRHMICSSVCMNGQMDPTVETIPRIGYVQISCKMLFGWPFT